MDIGSQHGKLLVGSCIRNIFHCEVVRCWGGLGASECRIVSNVRTASGVEVLELPVVLDVVACRDGASGCLELALGGSGSTCTNACCTDAGVRTVVECVVERWCVSGCGINTRHVSECRKEGACTFDVRSNTAVWHEVRQRSVSIRATRVGDLDVRVRRTTVECVTVQVGVSGHSLSDTDGTSVGLSGRDVSCSGT